MTHHKWPGGSLTPAPLQAVDESQLYKQQMAGGMGGNPMGAPDPKKAFDAEKQQIELVRAAPKSHVWPTVMYASGSLSARIC